MNEIKTALSRAHMGCYLFAKMCSGSVGICKVINKDSKRGRKGFVKIKILFANKHTCEIDSTALHTVLILRAATKEEIKKFQNTVEFPQHGAQSAPPPSRVQIIERVITKFEISEGQMLFFLHAGLKHFPCTAAELKTGRTKVLLALHPDTSQRVSDAEFKMVELAYVALKGLCK